MQTHVFRIPKGQDLFNSIGDYCIKKNIRKGLVNGIGAVQNLKFGCYNQEQKKYRDLEINKGIEMISLNGNISLKEGKPFPHLHIECADEEGKTFGGHLMPGTKVFVAEIIITELDGEPMERIMEEEIKLPLWPIQ